MGHIVYAHYRKSDNEIFYIGIGKTIKRAYSKDGRNKYWKHVVDKYDYNVEILIENITLEQATDFEISLIKFYGRKDLKEGPLVNLTDGGDGLHNPSEETLKRIHTPENTKKRLSSIDHSKWSKSEENIKRLISPENQAKANSEEAKLKRRQNTDYKKRSSNTDYSKLHTPELEEKRVKTRKENYLKKYPNGYPRKRKPKSNYNGKRPWDKKPILQYSLDGIFIQEWECGQDVFEKMGWDQSNIVRCLKGKQKSAFGYIWKYKSECSSEYISPKPKNKTTAKPIVQKTLTGEIIKEWESATEASKYIGVHRVLINKCCLGKAKTAKGFKWEYKF